ncbi:MAG: hypothetical protein JWQ00_2132 [Noviherbaspirillum sp.]|nr:hypothetical protein [Noviherbaspirillum sp.]
MASSSSPNLHASDTFSSAIGHADHEQYARQTAWYQRAAASTGNRFSRVMLMAGVFAVGAVMGLGTTWWMSKASSAHLAGTAIHKLEPVHQGRGSARHGGTAGSPRIGAAGINPAELPFDGKPTDGVPAAALPLAAIAAQGDERTGAGIPARPASAGTLPAETAAPVLPMTKKDNTAVANAVGSSGGDNPIAQPDTSKKKAASAPYRPRPPATVKDRDMGRSNQQAAELKTKNGSEQRADASSARTRYSERKTSGNAPLYAASGGSKRLAVARCESASNIFARERCKWQLCNGSWGKNGCPSYD